MKRKQKKKKKVPTRIYLGSRYEFIRKDILLNEIERLKNNNEVSDDKEYASYELDVACGYDMACNDILSFLSTLEESERPEPYNPVYDEAYLNEKIKKATESWKGVDVDAMLAECRGYDEEKSEKPMNLEGEINRYLHEECSDDDEPGIHEIAEHFAEWGYLRAAEKYNEIEYNRQRAEESVPKDLEEAANEFANQDCVTFISRKKGFIAGAEWQAKQDQETIELAEDHAYFAGAVNEREKMMKEAVEIEVWNYSSCADLRALPLWRIEKFDNLKDGDKVHVIVCKKED